MDILPEAASDFPSPPPPPPHPQRDWRQLKGIVSLNSAFENADSQSSTSQSRQSVKLFLLSRGHKMWYPCSIYVSAL